MLTTPENQNQFILPDNPDTQRIYYNMRFLISADQINPIAWEVSKKEDTMPQGIIIYTIKQDLYNPSKDNKELMIADYYSSAITPTPEEEVISKKYDIHYSGSPVVKVAGSYKTFSVENPDVDHTYTWNIVGLKPEDYKLISEDSFIKIKVAKNYNLIGTTFTLELYVDGSLSNTLECEVSAL